MARDVEDHLLQVHPERREQAREIYAAQGYFKIYNPEVIERVT